MPTKNPRLTITFEPALIARLRRLSELSGNSQGALVAELLNGCIPVMDRLITLMSAAKDVRAELADNLVADMEAAQSRVEAQLGLALGEFDQINAGLVEEAEQIRRRGRGGMRTRASAVAPAKPTPISNRGVRSTKNPSRTVP